MSTRSEDVRWAEADAETEARYQKENAPSTQTLYPRAELKPSGFRDRPHANRLLVPPPKVDGVTLRDWAIHYTQRSNIWESFVTDFYETAAGNPDVLQVFKDAAARRGIGAAELVADVQRPLPAGAADPHPHGPDRADGKLPGRAARPAWG
jgi:hypothetical protein